MKNYEKDRKEKVIKFRFGGKFQVKSKVEETL